MYKIIKILDKIKIPSRRSDKFIFLGYFLMFCGIVLFITAMLSQNFLIASTEYLLNVVTLNMGIIAGCWESAIVSLQCIQELGYLVKGFK